MNPKKGHHHLANNQGNDSPGKKEKLLEAQDRQGRLAEYHRMTNQRRKEINARVQKKREREQKEEQEREEQEKRENAIKLSKAVTPSGPPKKIILQS